MNQYRSGFFSSIPMVTKNLIIINLLFWLASLVFPQMTTILGLHFFRAENFNLVQLFTYMFMHGSFSHVFFNMFAVFMFGRILEQVWGGKRFLIFYLVCGVGAGLIQELVQFIYLYPYMSYPAESFNMFNTVGASGAVYGILLGFGMLFPNQPIFIFPLPVPIKAKYFVIGYAALELFLGVSNRVGDNVAHFAHLGGMLFGYFLIRYWRKQKTNNGNYF